MSNNSVDLRPPRKSSVFGVVWVIWAVLACALLVASGWVFAKQVPLKDTRSFSGVFEAKPQTIDLILPAGVPLETLTIQAGDRVLKGQKIALFDQTQLRHRASQLRTQLTLNAKERACLLEVNETVILPATPDSAATIATAHDLLSEAVSQRCANLHRRNALAGEKLLHQRNVMRAETALKVRELMQRAQATPASVQRVLTLRAALERESLLAAIRNLEFALALLVATQKTDILSRVDTLETHANALSDELVGVERHANAPWLIAPRGGKIARLRDVSGAAAHGTDVVLAQINASESTQFAAHFDLPADQARMLKADHRLWVRLSGLPLSTPLLPAYVVAVGDVAGQAFQKPRNRVFVEIGRPNVPLQADTLHTLKYLQQGAARSAMTLTLQDTRLSTVLQDSMQALFQSF